MSILSVLLFFQLFGPNFLRFLASFFRKSVPSRHHVARQHLILRERLLVLRLVNLPGAQPILRELQLRVQLGSTLHQLKPELRLLFRSRGRLRVLRRSRRLFRSRSRFRRLFRSRGRFRRLFRSRGRFRRLFRSRSRFRRLRRSRSRFRRLLRLRGGLLRSTRFFGSFLRFFLSTTHRFGALGGGFRGGFLAFALNFRLTFGEIFRHFVRNLSQLRRQLREERLRRSTLANNARVEHLRISAAVRIRNRPATDDRVRTVGDQTLSKRLINRRRFNFRLNNESRPSVLIRQIPQPSNDEIGRARNAQRNVAQFVENDDALTVAPVVRVH